MQTYKTTQRREVFIAYVPRSRLDAVAQSFLLLPDLWARLGQVNITPAHPE